MALTTTTLAVACALNDKVVTVTSATGFAAGNLILCDYEVMQVTKEYVSGTAIPVLRGREGSSQVAHVITANISTGLASDFTNAVPGGPPTTYAAQRGTIIQSITATSTLTLPPAGCDLRVILNGTSVITLTVPVPTKDMDGCMLTIVSNGVAAHVPTFTGGFGGVGSGYTALTVATGARLCIICVAVNGAWNVVSAPAWTGTVTKVTAGIA